MENIIMGLIVIALILGAISMLHAYVEHKQRRAVPQLQDQDSDDPEEFDDEGDDGVPFVDDDEGDEGVPFVDDDEGDVEKKV